METKFADEFTFTLGASQLTIKRLNQNRKWGELDLIKNIKTKDKAFCSWSDITYSSNELDEPELAEIYNDFDMDDFFS